MATLKKMTRVGADVRQIARLLQAKAPEGHMLAYITPEEAELLKSQGGSGKPHADTGIPSFEYDAEQYYSQDEAGTPVSLSPASAAAGTPLPPMDYTPNVTAPSYPSGFDAPVGADRFVSAYQGAPVQPPTVAGQSRVSEGAPYQGYATPFASAFPVGSFETQAGSSFQPYTIDTSKPAEDRSIMERLSEATGMKPEALSRLGLAGGLAALGSYQGGKARKQAEEAKREQQKLAEPYRQQGAELQRAAQAGELTPVAQQQLQAVQAQAAQQAAGRGGAVGAAQTQAQIEAFRAQLLQQQYDYGLKLSGIGDNIALGAIKTGLEADRYVQQLSNNFYTNMANIAGGLPAQAPQQYRSA
jgi:hypothetical protein